ncbi:MAG: hypothetical protein ACJ789_06480 [Thermomicrobiales bacterium]
MASENTGSPSRSAAVSSTTLDSTAPETFLEVRNAIAKLADAQASLSATMREWKEHPLEPESIELLLYEAQTTAQKIVERAELEALTIRRLMRYEADRFADSVERLKERIARLD